MQLVKFVCAVVILVGFTIWLVANAPTSEDKSAIARAAEAHGLAEKARNIKLDAVRARTAARKALANLKAGTPSRNLATQRAQAQRDLTAAEKRVADADGPFRTAIAKANSLDKAVSSGRDAYRAAAVASPYWALFGLAAVVALWILSAALTGNWIPISLAMGSDNRLSTSKFQILLWTITVGFVYIMMYADRVIFERNFTVVPDIPQNVLFALGISATTAVAAKTITGSQVGANPESKSANDSPSYDLSALVQGDEATTASLTKVQLLFWTVVAIVTYVATSMDSLGVRVEACNQIGQCKLPDIDTVLMIFMGIGHATYLGAKATPASQPTLTNADATPNPAAAGGWKITLKGTSLGSTAGNVIIDGSGAAPEGLSWSPTSVAFDMPANATGTSWKVGDATSFAIVVNGAASNPLPFKFSDAPAAPAAAAGVAALASLAMGNGGSPSPVPKPLSYDHIVFNRPKMTAVYYRTDTSGVSTSFAFDASGDAWGNYGGTDDSVPPKPPFGHCCWIAPGHYELGQVDDNGPNCASEGRYQIHVNDLSDISKRALSDSGHCVADPSAGTLDIGGTVLARGGLAKYNRLGVMVHGGGGNLTHPQDPRQPLLRTYGCTRVHNNDLATIKGFVDAARSAGKIVVFSCQGNPANVGR